MNTFKKHFTDAEGSFKIGYYYNSDFQKYVNSDKPLYLEWLATGNVPKEIAYVPPTPLTKEQKRSKVVNLITNKRETSFNAGVEYNGTLFNSDTIAREMILCGERKGKKIKDKDETIALSVILTNGSVVTLDQDDMIALSSLYDDQCIEINTNATNNYTATLTADEDVLDYYIAHNQYEV